MVYARKESFQAFNYIKKGMKCMKKISKALGYVLALATTIAAVGITPVSAAESEIKYNQTFSAASSVSDFSSAKGSSLDGTPEMTYNAELQCAEFNAIASRSGFVLPASVNEKNYVMEADIIYDKNENHNGTDSIIFGLIYAYQDADNLSYIGYNPVNGTIIMYNAIDKATTTRYSDKGKGASILLDEGETAKLKLIVNEGLMEFFVNGELCYTYYSPDDTRKAVATTNQRANNFAKGGRVGVYAQANKTKIQIDNVRVRTVGDKDVAFYSNTFIDPNIKLQFTSFNKLNAFFYNDTFTTGNWGTADYQGAGWSNIGQYIPVPVTGDYMIDVSFAMKNPLNNSRWMGISFGINKNEDGTISYNTTGIHENGGMFMSQKATKISEAEASGFVDGDADGAKPVYGNCSKTISNDKINPDYGSTEEDAEKTDYFLNYLPAGYTYESGAEKEVIARRNTMRITVVDGVASFTFGGTTISCDIDVNSTDGYVGLRSAGTAADIYSVRVAPYYVDEPVKELKTTMEFDYIDILGSYASADVIVDDPLNTVDEDTKVVLAAYEGGKLLGTDIKDVNKTGATMLEVEYSGVTDVDAITLKAFLWNIKTLKPVTGAISPQ